MDAGKLRVGLGNDVHRLGENRRLVLGGVEIPFDRGLIGHSDADVLLHALIDALLGATGQGDIGEWFPNTSSAHADQDSTEMLDQVLGSVRTAGWSLVNIDCIIEAENPRLAPYKMSIRERLAELLELDPGCVNVKAKSGERVGPIGRNEAIAAEVIVLLAKHDKEADARSSAVPRPGDAS